MWTVSRAEDPGSAWDAYAEAHPDGHLGHASAWARVLARAYELEPVYLEARTRSGSICGVLPLARFRSLTGAERLVSLPFLDSAGILADDPTVEAALVDAALGYGLSVELRQRRPLRGSDVDPSNRVDCFLPLAGDGEAALWRSLPGKVRNQTRKADKEGCAIDGAGDPVGAFQRIHRVHMRSLGSPAHAERFHAEVARQFDARALVLIARRGGAVAGGLVALRFAGAVTVPWASTFEEHRSSCVNNLLYWEALRRAAESGAREFDFGRSPRESGTHRFKRGWGTVERPLYWFLLDTSGHVRATQSESDSRALRSLTHLWRHLPTPLCDRCGPFLRKRIAS
jgi:FemAB-related protein (PEP-CTERM system-associated)